MQLHPLFCVDREVYNEKLGGRGEGVVGHERTSTHAISEFVTLRYFE